MTPEKELKTRAFRRARLFGENLATSPVIRDLTVGQITEIIHAFVRSQSADSGRQRLLTITTRNQWIRTNYSRSASCKAIEANLA